MKYFMLSKYVIQYSTELNSLVHVFKKQNDATNAVYY